MGNNKIKPYLKKYRPYIAQIIFVACIFMAFLNLHQTKDIINADLDKQHKEMMEQYPELMGTLKVYVSPEFEAIMKTINIIFYLFLGGLVYGKIEKSD